MIVSWARGAMCVGHSTRLTRVLTRLSPSLRHLSTPAATTSSGAVTPPQKPKNIFEISHQNVPTMPAAIGEVRTLDRAHDSQSYRTVTIKQQGRGSMTSSTGKGKSWVITFNNDSTPTSTGKTTSHSKDMWTNPLMKYQSSSDPLGNLTTLQSMAFQTPEKAMRFALKRGWDYGFVDFPCLVFTDNGDIFEGEIL
ncbi:hypothetical protein TL16_g08366 [Triparma laevis f. inornata]|uniref:NADH dehydrogenase [ubiquinone] iron-sulfur protein 4, mitochondrial n=1 Tax=Triparma laevis f. inornata TaxID=1714386 RepID=A0A9W7B5K8_9STRA|nr:hypothetical protein TL16_g08366 [Triparma laevis f. inornata]